MTTTRTAGCRRRLLAPVCATLAAVALLAGCSGDEGTTGTDRSGSTAAFDGSGSTGGTAAQVTRPTKAAKITPVAGQRDASSDGTTVTVTGDRAAFVTPSGGIACVMTTGSAMCDVDRSFVPQQEYLLSTNLASCTAEKATAITLSPEQGAWTCPPTPLVTWAAVSQGGWWAKAAGGETTTVDKTKVAVLPYGMSLAVGDVRCSSAETGVTCSKGADDFSVSRDRFTYH